MSVDYSGLYYLYEWEQPSFYDQETKELEVSAGACLEGEFNYSSGFLFVNLGYKWTLQVNNNKNQPYSIYCL